MSLSLKMKEYLTRMYSGTDLKCSSGKVGITCERQLFSPNLSVYEPWTSASGQWVHEGALLCAFRFS